MVNGNTSQKDSDKQQQLEKDILKLRKKLTCENSTFNKRDLINQLKEFSGNHRCISYGMQSKQLYDLVISKLNIEKVGLDHKQQERFSTSDMVKLEVGMLDQAVKLSLQLGHAVTGLSKNNALNSLKPLTLTVEQHAAFDYLTTEGDLLCMVGYAGTGKSFVLGAVRVAYENQGFRVRGAALAGAAAKSLEDGSGIESRTIASYTSDWKRGRKALTSRDIFVVDEAGMLGSSELSNILCEVAKSGAKLILVGDAQQLQPIAAGAAFKGIIAKVRHVKLTEIRRQKDKWQKESTKLFAVGLIKKALEPYLEAGNIHGCLCKETAISNMVRFCNNRRLQDSKQTQIMLAHLKDDVKKLNEQARMLRKNCAELGMEITFETFDNSGESRGKRTFAEQDRVYFLKNDRDLGVMNGSLGTIVQINSGMLTIKLDGRLEKIFVNVGANLDDNSGVYNYLDYGYATTIHKAQGVTVDRSYVLASRSMNMQLIYVAMSRHRISANLFYSKSDFSNYGCLVGGLSSNGAKDLSTDYLVVENLKVA